MSKSFFSLLISIFLLSITSVDAHAQEPTYSFVPEGAEIIISGEEFISESNQMLFLESEQLLEVPPGQSGVQLRSSSLIIHIQGDSRVQLGDQLELQAGSLHIQTREDTEEKVVRVGELELSFESAEFIAYVSGDASEQVIKVLGEGEVRVKNPETNQVAVLNQLQATSADGEGRLVIPYDIEAPQSTWWTSTAYQYDVEMLPVSHAGQDQRVLGSLQVSLNGEESNFKTGDIFEWTLVSAPKDKSGKAISEVAFDSTNIVKPLFTPTVDGEYRFSLQITNEDGGKSNVDEVSIFVGREFLKPLAIFPDVPTDHPNNLAITYLYKKNVMKGSKDAESGKITFRPDDPVNRVEILKTVFENKRWEVPAQSEVTSTENQIFEDVKPDHWFAPYVLLGKQKGIIKGNDGIYRPADKVLLVEALKIIVETNGISLDAFEKLEDLPYPDAEKDAWYNPYLFFVRQYNLFDVDAKGLIQPAKPLTRAALAEILYRMDSGSLLEKRGYVSGKLKNSENLQGVANAEVLIYKALEKNDGDKGKTTVKGDLYFKTKTKADGSFGVSLPIHTKFYIEALTDEDLSINKVITEVKENQTVKIELEIKTPKE